MVAPVVEPPAVALIAARAVLAVVFAAAAGAKLADQRGFRTALHTTPLPASLVPALVLVVPAVELAVAGALIVTKFSSFAALAALILLLLFSLTIGTGLARGELLECGCFGPLRAGSMGWLSVLRNLALAGLAGLIAVADHGSDSTASFVVGSAALLALAVGVLTAARQGRSVRRLGDSAPRQSLRTLSGHVIELGGAAASPETLLVFWDATCTACEQLTPHLKRLAATRAANARTIVVVSADTRERLLAERLRAPIVQDERRTLAHALGVPGKPAAVRVDSRGRVASDVILGAAAIAAVLANDPS
jgi:peroxiredoxin